MKRRVRVVGRISASILAVGLGLALTCICLLWWVDATELAGEGAIISGSVLTDLASLVALLVVILSTPVISGLVSIADSIQTDGGGHSLCAGVGSLFGAVVLVVLVAFAISLATSGDGGPEPLDLLTIAGLSGLTSAVAGALGSFLSS